MKKTLLLVIALVVTISLLFSVFGCAKPAPTPAPAPAPARAPAKPEFNWRYCEQTPETGLSGRASKYFANEVEKRSGGRIHIEVGYSFAFAAQKDMVPLTSSGVLEFITSASSLVVALVPEFGAFDIPLFFKDADEYFKLANETKAFEPLVKELAKNNLMPVNWINLGDRAFDTRKTPIKTADDLKGMKFRIMPSPILVKVWTAWGTKPVTIGAQEVPSALETGVIDGIDYVASMIWTFGFADFIKHITLSAHAITQENFMMHKPTFDRLPPDLQKIVLEVGKDAAELMEQLRDKDFKDAKANLEKAGTKFYTMAEKERSKLAEASAPIIEEQVAKYPILQQVVKARDQLRK